MKKLALLLLALPLTACAHNQLLSDALVQAKVYCEIGGVYPNDSRYPGCLNRFAGEHYDMQLHRLSDGSLTFVPLPGGPAAGPGPGPAL
jgi:hypothetical protein